MDCNDEINLIKLINKVNILQIKATDNVVLEDAIIRLVSLLLRGENANTIIPFIKNVIVTAEITLKQTLVQNINDILTHIPNNKHKFNLTEEEYAEIDIIMSHINSKNRKKIQGFSDKLKSFAEK